MDATFRQLRLFLGLYEHRSVSGLARAFHVSPPTVSMQLRDLSNSVGLPLYEFVGKRIHFTPAGEELAQSARAMMMEWSACEDRISAMKGLSRGRLRVAVVSTAKYFVPRILGEFCTKYPQVEIALEVLNRDRVVQRLRENLDDLYIMSMPPEGIDLEKRAFLSNPLVVAASASHRLSAQKGIRLEHLKAEPFLLRECGSGTRLACDAFFKKSGFSPVIRMELGSNEAIKQAVAGGLGLSVLSSHALGEHLRANALTVLDVQGFPIHSNWFTVHLAGKRLSPIAQEFLEFLTQQSAHIELQFDGAKQKS